jgi:hypothetical protein
MNEVVRKLILFEPNMNSLPHSEINSGFLSMMELAYQDVKLYFIGDKNHYKAIEEIKKFNRWNFIPTKIFSYEPRNFLFNDLFLLFKISKLLIHSDRLDRIYLLGIMPLTHIYISFLNAILKKNIVICLHGQMEAYLKDTKIGFSKYYYRLSKFVFKRNDNLNYLFFGDSIKKNLLFLFNKNKKLISIDQPYLYKSIPEKTSIELNEIITLGFLGRFDGSKNVKEFFRLVDSLEQEIINNSVIIKIIGKVNYKIPNKYHNLITFYNRTLSQNEFRTEVLKLDFVLSFTDENFYKATPSGVFFDCIKWEVPILALNNDFISYYFDKYDKIGELFKNTNEMILFVSEKLLYDKKNEVNYSLYINNIRILKNQLSIVNLKENLINQI